MPPFTTPRDLSPAEHSLSNPSNTLFRPRSIPCDSPSNPQYKTRSSPRRKAGTVRPISPLIILCALDPARRRRPLESSIARPRTRFSFLLLSFFLIYARRQCLDRIRHSHHPPCIAPHPLVVFTSGGVASPHTLSLSLSLSRTCT
jgi:hypothetical protein